MRYSLWLMALFAIAVASALFAGNNHGSVTLFWPPYRVDFSLNFILLILALSFLVLHFAMRALAALLKIPQDARRWRVLQKERFIHVALLDALAHLFAGRFIRGRKCAEQVIALEASVDRGGEHLSYAGRLRTLAHLLAGEGAHALQDRGVRDAHFQLALKHSSGRDGQDVRDGVYLRAARWAMEDRDAGAALQWLDQLPLGAGRRTLALRLRFKAARLAGRIELALETARLLTKHRAFTELAGRSIARGLAIEMIRSAHDPLQVQRAWESLERSEQHLPEVAVEAAERLLAQEGDALMARHWLLPVWEAMLAKPDTFNLTQRVRLVQALEQVFNAPNGTPDTAWLTRIETAQLSNPRDAVLQYLAGVVCMRLQLWGKSQQLLKQSLSMLSDASLRRDAWLAMAQLAEQRQDAQGAAQAYRQACGRG